MQKFTTYIILIAFTGVGLFSLYRGLLSSSDLMMVEGKVVGKQVEPTSRYKGSPRYGLTFTIESYNERIGIYAGTFEQATTNSLLNQIDTGQIYTFLIDPTVVEDRGIQLGIREIKLKDKTLYKESGKSSLLIGAFFTILGTCGLYLITKFKRGKKR